MGDNLAWEIADTLNGLMMLPNLVGVLALSPVVYRCTQNYIARNLRGEAIEPLLSNYQPRPKPGKKGKKGGKR